MATAVRDKGVETELALKQAGADSLQAQCLMQQLLSIQEGEVLSHEDIQTLVLAAKRVGAAREQLDVLVPCPTGAADYGQTTG